MNEWAEKRITHFRSQDSLINLLLTNINCLEEYKKIKAQVLVMQADNDELFPIKVGELITDSIGRDKAKLKILENCTHDVRTQRASYIVDIISKFML